MEFWDYKCKWKNAVFDSRVCREEKKTLSTLFPFWSYCNALLRSTGVVPDDIFIPKDKKEKVEVIRRIRYLDTEAEIGEFLANIYLIKVKLEKDESIPIYYASRKTRCLTKHDVIYRSSLHKNEYSVETGLTTWIMLNDKNKSDYISLSKLC